MVDWHLQFEKDFGYLGAVLWKDWRYCAVGRGRGLTGSGDDKQVSGRAIPANLLSMFASEEQQEAIEFVWIGGIFCCAIRLVVRHMLGGVG